MNTQFGICEEGCVGFSRRHIGPSPRDAEEMLRFLSVDSLDALIEETVPQSIRQQEPLDWPALSETEVLSHLANVASRNRVFTSLIGQGYYGAILPPVIQRNILENPAWYTAYTPYQPEISQGRLEALFNFQTMICDLTGFDIANASLLDEATAAAEAMAMARRVAKVEPTAFFVDAACHPQTIAVLATRAEPLNWTLIVGDPLAELDPSLVFGALFQYPGTDGRIRDFGPAIVRLKKAGAISVMAADPLALTLLVPPAELGADLAVGSTQRFGVPMGYGGPHAAYIAARDAYKRALPGRLVGASVDSRGAKAYRLALQTREQHIRREKATSNICTAQVLLAVIASMYAVYHGPDGLAAIARRIHKMTATLGEGLGRLGFAVGPDRFFDTITVAVGSRVDEIRKRAEANNLNFRFIDDDKANAARVGISLDETTTPEVIAKVWHVFGGDLAFDRLNRESTHKLSEKQIRRSPFLTHPVFHQHRSETEMLRYMRRLADRDLALDRAMIPLGSCTMKLNATVEMIPVTMSQFSALHPFAPTDQAEGYSNMLGDLEAKLCAITGYDAISFQPNSGAQGEYAGLLVIRAYHRSRGEKFRNVCLIPSSAHGTNPASAHLAGMEVVVVNCDQSGNVEIVDLHMKAGQHARELAAIMVTYPSTHGVFEEGIRDICEIVHAHGGQVYLDGANLNAQVGVARPADYGADVSHLNLHKTFCIPHGGGGPGMGPIGVRAHLIPFLPGDPQRAAAGRAGPVSAAPFGSASILSVSFAYMLLMGGNGLTLATKTAILNANYVATRLEGYYPILYKGPRGRVAHECILDPRALKDLCGVTVQDIAKRLIDYGFHAPTVSFPVPGTLMVEPTESESKAELDRFCNAMIAIRKEIDDIEKGRWPVAQSPLRNAPHTVHDLATDEWTRPYSRSEGCFPHGSTHRDKYWSPVNRVDDAHGDRNLVCTYPPSDYQTAAQ